MKIVTLGPEGTFAHSAAQRIGEHLQDQASICFERTITKVFNHVQEANQQTTTIGVVPLENSDAGSVGSTLDNLAARTLYVYAEIDVRIEHNLAAFCEPSRIRRIYVHPQTHAQCERYLERELPEAEVTETASNAHSAELLLQDKEIAAAVVPSLAARLYETPMVAEGIENSTNNTTRFIAISQREHDNPLVSRREKTSIIIDPRFDRPGLLYDILGVFADYSINLSKIESRPSGRELGDYMFYIELETDLKTEKLQSCLNQLRELAHVKILGVYDNIG